VNARSFVPLLAALCAAFGCDPGDLAPGLSKEHQQRPPRVLGSGQYFPRLSEAEAVGALERRVRRGTRDFARLVKNDSPEIVFKDEERSGADRMMRPAVRVRLNRLAALVRREWPALSLRVTEAWDEDGEHGNASVHYAGRAVDVTTSDVDPSRLGRLAGLALEAGFDWVYREKTHVHVSVRE
jgi:hypothetical protein